MKQEDITVTKDDSGTSAAILYTTQRLGQFYTVFEPIKLFFISVPMHPFQLAKL